MSFSPYLKSPLTDLTGEIVSHQWYGTCADFEMKALECLEAYGLDGGLKKCQPLMQDFQECALKVKQFKRVEAMRMERHRQWFKGERSSENHYASPPKPDSF